MLKLRTVQLGITLIELMITLSIATIVLGMIGTVFLDFQLKGSQTSLNIIKTQQVEAVSRVITTEIKRIGFGQDKSNTFITIKPFDSKPNELSNCIIAAYDIDSNGQRDHDDTFGFRYDSDSSSGKIQVYDRTKPTSWDNFSCDDSNGWTDFFPDDELEITDLKFELISPTDTEKKKSITVTLTAKGSPWTIERNVTLVNFDTQSPEPATSGQAGTASGDQAGSGRAGSGNIGDDTGGRGEPDSDEGNANLASAIIDGTQEVGYELTASLSKPNEIIGYKWKRNGVEIDSQTSVYTLTKDDGGKKISVTITHNDAGVSREVTSEETGPIFYIKDCSDNPTDCDINSDLSFSWVDI